jgi:hypothetical protein
MYTYAYLLNDGNWHLMPFKSKILGEIQYRCKYSWRSYRIFLNGEMIEEYLVP